MYQMDELLIESLVTQKELENQLPISAEVINNVNISRKRIEHILRGKDKRLLVVIGPCSIHDSNAALEYAGRISIQRKRYQSRLEIVMRTYFEKPRTVIGWKGLILDPALDESYQINQGIKMARKLLRDINKLSVPTATEFLDISISPYIADLISWGAIGARTTESQIHREMASTLPCPIGFKNRTDGDTQVAVDAIRAARARHAIILPDKDGKMAIYQSKGNPYCHIIMRGGKLPNYHVTYITSACENLRKFDLPEYLIVDFSHGNSKKSHSRQLDVAENVCHQIRTGSTSVVGVMAESFLVEGAQQIVVDQEMTYGQSITDPCLNWSDSERLLAMLADAVDTRF
jgi:3-deoxy-7-phosphoheptulonate synthase